LANSDYRWRGRRTFGAKPQLPEPFTIERIIPLMDEAGVDRVVIVPPASLDGEHIDYFQEAVKRYPSRFAIMARVALDKPDRAARLATWRDQPGVLGVRLNFGPGEAAWLTDGTADWFWPTAEKARLPVMFLTSGQTSLFRPHRRATPATYAHHRPRGPAPSS
jgi:predicted TIM-barrel fold metal-dependent hydrolase